MEKVLVQIDACRNYGSTGRITEQLGLMAKKLGWSVYIVHGSRYVNPSQLRSIQVVSRWEEYWHALETKLFDNHGLSSSFATKRLINKLQELKPALVHLHTIHGYYINYKILFAWLKDAHIPVVWTLHDCWNFTGHCSYFDFINCNKWKIECYQCPLKKAYPSSIAFDRSRRNFELKKRYFTSIDDLTLVPVSFWLESLVKESFFSKMQHLKICTIHNGIDLDVFKPCRLDEVLELKSRLKLGNKKVLLGCASPWTDRKGYSDFLKLRSLLDDSYTIVMVGLSAKQKRIAEKVGIIGILRTQSVHELALYYSMSDLFLNLTYEDNFPTTNIESLACGTPVLTYNTGGSPEAIDEGTGKVVNKGDFPMLMNCIEQMTFKEKNALVCRNRAIRYYDKEDRFQEYMHLYETLINKR